MQLVDATIAAIPLWLLFPLLVALFLLCCVAGAKLRRRLANEPEERAPDSYILSAVLGLLGLMIAFTFSMALSRYDERREIVVSEANAIGTAWLRAGLIEGAGGAALQNSLTHYAELRSRLPHEGETEAVERETAEAQRQLWAQMRQSLGATPPPISATLINAMNEMFDIAAARKAEREAHIPGAVVEILLLYALLSAGIVGYVLGASEARHRGITFVLFVLLTLSLVLILDLDRPWRGGVTVSQQPMADLVAGLKTRR
jgi:hypothetical protein